MIRIASAALVALAFATSANAYELRAKSDSSQISVQELSDMVHKIGEEVGHNIPDSDQIRVHAIVQSKKRANSDEFLWNYRVELRKLLDGRDTPPYPVAGWFVIYTSEDFGIGTAEQIKGKIEGTIRKFFTELKKVNPKTEAP